MIATILSALISALETALFCLKEHHVAKIARSRPALSGLVLKMAKLPRERIHQILVLSSIANLSLAILGFFLVREGPALIFADPLANAFAVFCILVVFGDFIPKLFALTHPEVVFAATVRPFHVIAPALEKVASTFGAAAERVAGAIVSSRARPDQGFSDEEVETLVEMRRDAGFLAPSESDLIQVVIQLGNKTAKDCMTPRTDSFMLEAEMDPEEALEQVRSLDSWVWRIPIYRDRPDVVIGTLDVKKWLQNPGAPFMPFVSPPVFVPETMNALDTFRRYLNRPKDLAVIVDEYGGVEGVLAYSDLIEELLEDAAPVPESEEEFEEDRKGNLVASGDARLDEISKTLGVDLEQEGLDTIGGLVMNRLGHVPEAGESLAIGDVTVAVKKTDGPRITEVVIDAPNEKSNGREKGD
ncbi:MAG: HlyC/CorC family transporter [Verrucomicrobiales bacterium]|nr:HlyC/CorC family transporter [Verrucomicrobiales bacterium]